MGQVTARRPEEIGGFTEAELNSMIIAIPGRIGPTHPNQAPTAQAQARFALMMWEVNRILSGRRPSSGARRRLYDTAVRQLGDGDLNSARNTLDNAHAAAIGRVLEQVQAEGDVGDHRQAMITMLETIDRGIGEGEPEFVNYDPHGSDIASLLRALRGGEARAVPRAEDRAATRTALPLIEHRLHDPGPIRLISRSADESIVSMGGTVTPTTLSLFGSQAAAQAAMDAIGNAYATMANHPNDLSAQQTVARALHEALSQIPANKEIWNNQTHPNFQAAMTALAAGNLQQGLSELAQEPAFNTVFDSMNDLFVISVNQRAISVLRAGVTVRYEFDRNMESFREFIRGSRDKIFQPRVLWLAMGLHYEYLLVSGVLNRFRIDPEAQSITVADRRRITGTGHVVTATPQVGFGFSLWGNPIEAVIHANLGYQRIDIGADVEAGAESRRLDIVEDGVAVGAIGAEVWIRGREGRRSIIRVPRVGAGVAGGLNPYFNFTLRGTWAEGNTMRITTDLTPQYSYFLEQHRVGYNIEPVNFELQLSPDWMLFFGPGFRHDMNLTDPGNIIHTLEGYGRIGFRFSRGAAVDLRAGAMGEVGGEEYQRLPTTPFGSLNITITPQLWGEGERRVPAEARPRRTARRRRREE